MAGTEALLASQINGGGCLPPPTPSAPSGQMFKEFGKMNCFTLEASFHGFMDKRVSDCVITAPANFYDSER